MNEDATLDREQELVKSLFQNDLAQYILDSDCLEEIIDAIERETKIRKIYIRLFFKSLSFLFIKGGKALGTWAGSAAAHRLNSALKKLAWYNRCLDWLENFKDRLDGNTHDKNVLKDILAGKRPPREARECPSLSDEIHAILQTENRIEELTALVEGRFDRIEDLLRPQPHLELVRYKETRGNRLHFRAQRVPFMGREAEMARLQDFLAWERNFGWLIVTGPGGIGKSRLALEFCLRNGSPAGWHAGFLARSFDTFDWHKWEPEEPTLLIIDYVSGRAEAVHDLIVALENRGAASFSVPVRVLLLEREAEGTWWDRFISGQDAVKLSESAFVSDPSGITPYRVNPLDSESLWTSMVHIMTESKATVPDKDATIAQLERVDPNGRPLVAAILAESLCDNDPTVPRDLHRLLKNYVNRERFEFWHPNGATDRYENLLALATMCGGLPIDFLERANYAIPFPSLISGNPHLFSGDLYRLMVGRSIENSLFPLEPDFVGEIFVLEHLRKCHQKSPKYSADIYQAAWDVGPAGFRIFLKRLIHDFGSDSFLKANLLAPPQGRPARTFWWVSSIEFIYLYGFAGDPATARFIYDRFVAMADEFSNEKAFQESLFMADFSMAVAYRAAGDIAMAQTFARKLVPFLNGSKVMDGFNNLFGDKGMGSLKLLIGFLLKGDQAV